MKKVLFITIAVLTVTFAFAQNPQPNAPNTSRYDKKAAKRQRINNLLKMEEEGDLIFNKHNIFGLKLATDGYGIFFEKGKYKTVNRTLIFQAELNEKKSPKENKAPTYYTNGFNVNSIVLYKLNNFYQFKLSVGQQHLIGGKGNKNGVAVTALYTGGVSIGLLKPYLLDIAQANQNSKRQRIDDFLADTSGDRSIIGASGFFAGWDDLTIKPGVNAKAAMRFDYGRFNVGITAIEAGISAEYYFGKIPQVYLVPYKNFFFNAYISLMFGKRK